MLHRSGEQGTSEIPESNRERAEQCDHDGADDDGQVAAPQQEHEVAGPPRSIGRRDEMGQERRTGAVDPIRGRRDSLPRSADRNVTRRARSLSRTRRPCTYGDPHHIESRPPTFETAELRDEVDSEQVFLQLMRVMISQNKAQHELQKEVQRQNTRLIERLAQPIPAGTQEHRLPSSPDSSRQGVAY